MAAALSIISRVIFPFSSASPHNTPGKSVVVKPSREQAERTLRRSSMRNPLVDLKLARHYKPERRSATSRRPRSANIFQPAMNPVFQLLSDHELPVLLELM